MEFLLLVYLYFPNRKEEEASIRAVRRIDGETNAKTQDPDTKYISNATGKHWKMDKRSLNIVIEEGHFFIEQDASKGIQIKSNQAIQITSEQDIQFQAPSVHLTAKEEISLEGKNSSLILDNETHFKSSKVSELGIPVPVMYQERMMPKKQTKSQKESGEKKLTTRSEQTVIVGVEASVKNLKSKMKAKNDAIEEARKKLIQSVKSYEPPILKDKKLKKFASDITGVSALEQVISDVSNKQVSWKTALDAASITPIGKVTKLTKVTSKTKGVTVKSVNNMDEFFKTAFGKSIKGNVKKTKQRFHEQSIYVVTKEVSPYLKKGYKLYLDNLHKDHLEVFDKNGKFKLVLNLDGTLNQDKTKKAEGRSLRK